MKKRTLVTAAGSFLLVAAVLVVLYRNEIETLRSPGSFITRGQVTEEVPVSDFLALDNTIKCWGVKPTEDGTPPRVPDSLLQPLKKYGGFYLGDTGKKEVFLTFDEGYEAGYTEEILDILKKHGVKAAFFITGHYLKTNPELVLRMVREGHIVGNHTVNHPSLPSLSEEQIRAEVSTLAANFKELTGREMSYFRPPRGEYSTRVMAVIYDMGYRTAFWSLAFADWVPLPDGAEGSYRTVMERLHNGAVILLHATSGDNADALDRIIRDIKQKGYSFRTLDELEPSFLEE